MRLAGAVDANVSVDEILARHTTYRIGGPAALFITPNTYSALLKTIQVLKSEDVSWVVMGRGSNILVSDEGYDGAVIFLGREFSKLEVNHADNTISVGAGCNLAKVVATTITEGLSGLEMCVGIPGTVGGAIAQNAGSKTEWISRSLKDLVVLKPEGELHKYTVNDIDWGYRTTSIPTDEIILEATFEFKTSTKQKVGANMETRLARRKAVQPLGVPSCGSVYKSPEGYIAGKLLEDAGCKGYRVGGACVSLVHANFVVNDKGATASDVLQVMQYMYKKVKDEYGIELQPEVKFLGFTS